MTENTNGTSASIDYASRFQLIQMTWGYIVPRALHVAAELGIADQLIDGPKPISKIAKNLNCNEDALYRLLRCLASVKIFQEKENRLFSLTKLSQLLRSDVPGSVRDGIRIVDETLWNPFGNLQYSIEIGKPSFEKLMGTEFFEHHSLNENAQINDLFSMLQK